MTEAPFIRRGDALHCEAVPLHDIAREYGTPTYVYSRRAIASALCAYQQAIAGRDGLICYAMKANSNLAILNLVARAHAGFDIVSGGELARVLAAGGDPRKVVFSGVGKTEAEIEQALHADILCFNIESASELQTIQRVATRIGRVARISVRVNPDVDPRTHPYISTGLKGNKFGVAYANTLPLYLEAARMEAIEIVGIDCHIGSQITEISPYVAAADRLLDLVDALAREGIRLRHIDFGGGLGMRYRDETPPDPAELIGAVVARLDARGHSDKSVIFEPGRSIVGPAGALLMRVIGVKRGETKNFVIVDAAMNDQMRPTLYQAWMDVQPVQRGAGPALTADVVGPICESGDWLARARELALEPGDLLAMLGAGAYGMSMASNYNSRPRAAEVLVDGDTAHCVRARETVASLFAGESVLP